MNRNNGLSDNLGNRIAIFVDTKNIFKVLRKHRQARLNYTKFLEWCAGNCSIVSIIAYVMLSDEPDNERKFLDALRLNGYDIKAKKTYYGTNEDTGDKYAINDWTLGMSLDISLYYKKVDTIVIVSSDNSFIDTCYFYKNRGTRIEVISIKEATDLNLIKAATSFTNIPDNCMDTE